MSTADDSDNGALARLSASQSFTPEEVECLHFLLTSLLRGGDVRAVTRNKAFASLYRKALTMKVRLQQQAEKRASRKD